MEACVSKAKCCIGMCQKLMKLCGTGLILWGVGYAINSFVHLFSMWGYYSGFLLIKICIYRLGLSFAAILFAGMAIHYTCGCCKHNSCCKSETAAS